MIGLNVTIVELDGAFIHIQQLKKRAAQQNRTNSSLSIGRKGGIFVVINPGQVILKRGYRSHAWIEYRHNNTALSQGNQQKYVLYQ